MRTTPTCKQLTHVCPRVPVRDVKLTAESAAGSLSTCPRAHKGSASHLHLHIIAVRHVQCMDIVTCVCACLLGFSVAYDGIRAGHFWFADRLFASRYTCALFKHVSLHAGVMVKRPPGTTGVGLLPRSNTRRTVTLGGANGPLVATMLITMTVPVSRRTASQVARPRTMRR